MLHLFHSNRMESLVDALGRLLCQALRQPLAPECLVVQNTGLARWLDLRLAEQLGIAANHVYRLPSSFVWWLFKHCLDGVPEVSPFDKESLFWRIFQRLPELGGDAAYAPLRDYLSDDANGLKRYQLARRIADVMDQYLVYRPDWILDWEQGEGEHWQARLWRELRRDIQGEHRASLLQRFLAEDLSRRDLPQRVAVFGVSYLPPVVLEVLRHLSLHTEVHCFLLNPSYHYWGDILPKKSLDRLREHWRREGLPDLSDYYETGNPLLAAWGSMGRDFQRLLYQDNVPDEADGYRAPPENHLLGLLQRDLLSLKDRTRDPVKTPVDDDSIRIHVCHSPLREVEALHDRLLDLLQRHPDLQARDMVVMTPDIDRYAPYVEAVFGSAPEDRYLPWSLADVSVRGESPLIDMALDLLRLPDSRFAASEILGLLEVPAVLRRLGLSEAELPLIRRWVEEAGIRWARSGEDKQRLGQQAEDINTWRFGFQRLFFGYALPDGLDRYGDLAPMPGMEGSQMRVLGLIKGFFERLGDLAELFARPCGAAEWQTRINQALDQLLDAGDDEQILERLRSALDRLAQGADAACMQAPLGREVVRAFLRQELGTGGAEHRYAAGRVSFCAMVPMRAVPFRVVALLGLNDRDYPRRVRPPGFDLMAGDRRPGDRSAREEDRHLFLEALLSARDYLVLSYVGADQRDNSELQPSLMLSQLTDYIESGFQPSGPLRVRYPLQPFSPRYHEDPGLRSYATEWDAAMGGSKEIEPFCETPLAEPEQDLERVELDQLVRFFEHAARHFLRHRLGIIAPWDEAPLEDDEAFELDSWALYRMRQDLLRAELDGAGAERELELYRLRGELPRAVYADLALRPELARLREMAAALRPHVAEEAEPLELDLSLGGLRLVGWLDGLGPRGRVSYRPAAFGGRDLLGLWLRHLALNALDAAPPARASRHRDVLQWYELPPLESPRQAHVLLHELLKLYQQGQSRPLSFFPQTSYVYAEEMRRRDDTAKALDIARSKWAGDPGQGRWGEGQDGYHQIAFRDADPLGAEFVDLAERIYGPVLDLLQT